jgi:hypothetical protein
LFVVVHPTDPGGEWQDTITSNGKSEPGGCNNYRRSSLYKDEVVRIVERWGRGRAFTEIKPNNAIMVMKTQGPFPSAIA